MIYFEILATIYVIIPIIFSVVNQLIHYRYVKHYTTSNESPYLELLKVVQELYKQQINILKKLEDKNDSKNQII